MYQEYITPCMYNLQTLIREDEMDFLRFLQKCFEWNPLKRMIPSEGLIHEWIISQKLTSKSSILNKNISK